MPPATKEPRKVPTIKDLCLYPEYALLRINFSELTMFLPTGTNLVIPWPIIPAIR